MDTTDGPPLTCSQQSTGPHPKTRQDKTWTKDQLKIQINKNVNVNKEQYRAQVLITFYNECS